MVFGICAASLWSGPLCRLWFKSSCSYRLWQAGRWLLVMGWLLAAAGDSFAPWVYRAPAALALTAPDLAEFVKFLPEVRDGTLTVQRLLFLAPLFGVVVGAPLVVSSARLAYPGWLRGVMLAAVVPLALMLLPPVWSPPVLMDAEFRPQAGCCVLCLLLVAASTGLRRLPFAPLAALLAGVWLATPFAALGQFLGVQAAVSAAYASPVAPGWGVWVALSGGALMSAGLLLAWIGQRAARCSRSPSGLTSEGERERKGTRRSA